MTKPKHCELCDKQRYLGETCDQPKNGYCALFRLQAEHDAAQVNIAPTKPSPDGRSEK